MRREKVKPWLEFLHFLWVTQPVNEFIDVDARMFRMEHIHRSRCVICRLFVYWGGGKSVDFFRNFRHTYFNGFSRYNSDQVIKKHLLDQENWLARTRRARARLRARKPRSRPVILEKSRKLFKLWVTYFGAQRARNRARAHLVHANRLSWSWRWFLTTWSLA